MMELTKKPHAAIICRSYLENFIINLLNNEYKYCFDIVITNSILKNSNFIYSNDFEEIQKNFKGKKILFITELHTPYVNYIAHSGRHTNLSVWFLASNYNSIDKDFRSMTSWVCSFYCKNKNYLEKMINENYTYDVNVEESYKLLEAGGKLIIKTDFPRKSLLSI